jgi:hypothetical protein
MGSVTGAKPAKVLSPVLCVDLDGTLIRGNVLWECILVLLKTRPITLLLLPFWLLSGRACLKRQLADRIHLDPARLPYRQQVLDLLQQEKATGRRIALQPPRTASLPKRFPAISASSTKSTPAMAKSISRERTKLRF